MSNTIQKNIAQMSDKEYEEFLNRLISEGKTPEEINKIIDSLIKPLIKRLLKQWIH